MPPSRPGRSRGTCTSCSGHLAGGREQAQQQLAEVVGADAVEVVLALAPRLDQAGDPQQSQVVADRRLALAEPLAQVGDVQLAVLGERR